MEKETSEIKKTRCDRIIGLIDAVLNDTEVVGFIPFEEEPQGWHRAGDKD